MIRPCSWSNAISALLCRQDGGRCVGIQFTPSSTRAGNGLVGDEPAVRNRPGGGTSRRPGDFDALQRLHRSEQKKSLREVPKKRSASVSQAESLSNENNLERSFLNRETLHSSVITQSLDDYQNSSEIRNSEIQSRGTISGTVYLVDIHPLCYKGKRPRPTAILKWMKLLFDDVTREDPVIAVFDGEKGNDYRRQLLPGYKARRNKYKPLSAGVRGPYYKGDEMDLREAFPLIQNFLKQCNVPVLTVEDAEADDVVATLMHQARRREMRVVVASPDMDFRQLLSENVNLLLPLPEFGRWSFYTLEQYMAQNTCDPSLDLGLRCILGDSSDNVPGLSDLVPAFGRKTALKLMKKHGSLESLLVAARTRTVGKPYIQDALTQHADILWRNLEVLKLRRDLDITLNEDWCRKRDRSCEAQAFRLLEKALMKKSERKYSHLRAFVLLTSANFLSDMIWSFCLAIVPVLSFVLIGFENKRHAVFDRA